MFRLHSCGLVHGPFDARENQSFSVLSVQNASFDDIDDAPPTSGVAFIACTSIGGHTVIIPAQIQLAPTVAAADLDSDLVALDASAGYHRSRHIWGNREIER